MLYSYRAVDRTGKTLAGERDASSEREIADFLRAQGYLLLEAAPRSARAHGRFLFPGALPNPFRRITLVERMLFARNLAVMVAAGLGLTHALEVLIRQSPNPRFIRMLTEIREAVTRGKTFAESLTPHAGTFGSLFINMVEAGELSGGLERNLKILARQMQRDHDLRAKVRGAMFYPAIVVAALIGIGVLMMVWVVPTLTQTFSELEIDLPLTTRSVIGVSAFIIGSYPYLIAAVALLAALLARFVRSPRGKELFGRWVLRLPVFGALAAKINSARFARTLASLLASGIPITRSLEVTASVLSNSQFRRALAEAAGAIQHGEPLHRLLESRPNLFPPMVTQMIQVGEETGTLSRMLLRLALFYEGEVTSATRNLSSIIEPVLMIMIGAAVGFFAVAMIQPIYSGLGNL